MGEAQIYRTEFAVPTSWSTEYHNGQEPKYLVAATKKRFIGYFSYSAAVKTVAMFVRQECYEKPDPPTKDSTEHTIEFLLLPHYYLDDETISRIMLQSLKNENLNTQQAAEVNIEVASLGRGFTPTYSPQLSLLGFYIKKYATKKWGSVKKSEEHPKGLVVRSNIGDGKRFDLLSSQLLAPNRDALGPSRLQDLSLALRPLILKEIVSDKATASDLEELLRLTVRFNQTIYRVDTRDGAFVGHFKEAQVLELWGNYIANDKRKIITLADELPDEERRHYLTEELEADSISDGVRTLEIVDALAQLDGDVDGTIARVYSKRASGQNKSHVSPVPNNPNWRSLFRRVKALVDAVEHDPVAGGKVLREIRAAFSGDGQYGLSSITRRAFAAEYDGSVVLNGREFDPTQVLGLALIGHSEATELLTKVLLSDAEGSIAGRSARNSARRSDDNEELPDWAKPEKAHIIAWADKTIEKEPTGLVDDIAHFIAERVKKGGVNVLVFDTELYSEVVGAELMGETTGKIEEFPFQLTVIRMQGFPDIYGAVVFRRQDFRKAAVTAIGKNGKYGDGYEVAYILNRGGVTLDPGLEAVAAAEKLTIYLDCDNAIIETVYVDGISTGRKNNPRPKKDTPDYVHGAAVEVGSRVVIEREKQKGGTKRIFKRAHFRRGFYKRQRVGPRDNWRYETRWIKPTFVRGSMSIVTERRVQMVVL